MSITIAGRTLHRAKVVDDDANARRSVALVVNDADLEAIEVAGPLPSLQEFVRQTVEQSDAIVCDHRLKRTNYALFDGAEAVASFYRERFPAVLCTSYVKADIDSMRQYRREIPALFSTPANPDNIARGLEQCIEEFSGHFRPTRKLWRTLIRVEDRNDESVPHLIYVVVPGWSAAEAIRLPMNLLPTAIQPNIKPGSRLFAKTNLGAEKQEDLFFQDFEPV
jgi:CheY-like chemotaxis protein